MLDNSFTYNENWIQSACTDMNVLVLVVLGIQCRPRFFFTAHRVDSFVKMLSLCLPRTNQLDAPVSVLILRAQEDRQSVTRLAK